jgi:hypothetical protein
LCIGGVAFSSLWFNGVKTPSNSEKTLLNCQPHRLV